MSFKIFWISLITIVFSFPSLCFSEPDSNVWEFMGNNLYYNKTNIRKSSKVISIWIYEIVTADLREEMIETVKKYDLEKSIKYQHFDNMISVNEIDCKNRLTRVKRLINYDDNGSVIDDHIYNNSEWSNILTESIGGKLYQKFCVTEKKSSKKK
jgi:hypothetical protein